MAEEAFSRRWRTPVENVPTLPGPLAEVDGTLFVRARAELVRLGVDGGRVLGASTIGESTRATSGVYAGPDCVVVETEVARLAADPVVLAGFGGSGALRWERRIDAQLLDLVVLVDGSAMVLCCLTSEGTSCRRLGFDGSLDPLLGHAPGSRISATAEALLIADMRADGGGLHRSRDGAELEQVLAQRVVWLDGDERGGGVLTQDDAGSPTLHGLDGQGNVVWSSENVAGQAALSPVGIVTWRDNALTLLDRASGQVVWARVGLASRGGELATAGELAFVEAGFGVDVHRLASGERVAEIEDASPLATATGSRYFVQLEEGVAAFELR